MSKPARRLLPLFVLMGLAFYVLLWLGGPFAGEGPAVALTASGVRTSPPKAGARAEPAAEVKAAPVEAKPAPNRIEKSPRPIFGEPAARPAPAASPAPPAAARVKTRKIRMLVTAYCPCRKCCGRHSNGVTASGHRVGENASMFVAADTRILRFGTRVSVPGYHGGAPVPVWDRGGKIKGNRLDVFFRSHARAARWGSRWLTVTVYGD